MEIQVIVAVMQIRPIEIQVNVVELHLSSIEIHVRLAEKQVVVIYQPQFDSLWKLLSNWPNNEI